MFFEKYINAEIHFDTNFDFQINYKFESTNKRLENDIL